MAVWYFNFSSDFWDGNTGRELRKCGDVTRLVAIYLFTGPHADPLGLYRVPLPTLVHHVGVSDSDARSALADLERLGFAYYDFDSDEVWVPSMASFQYGVRLTPHDNRHRSILKQLPRLQRMRFFSEFYARYRVPFNLPEEAKLDAPLPPIERKKKPASSKKLRKFPAAKNLVLPKLPHEDASAPSEPDTTPKRETWITPYEKIWKEIQGGSLPIEKSLAPLSKVRKEHGDDLALRVWGHYLGEQGRFASAAQFEQRFNAWREEYEAAEASKAPEPTEFAWMCPHCGEMHKTAQFWVGMPCPDRTVTQEQAP